MKQILLIVMFFALTDYVFAKPQIGELVTSGESDAVKIFYKGQTKVGFWFEFIYLKPREYQSKLFNQAIELFNSDCDDGMINIKQAYFYMDNVLVAQESFSDNPYNLYSGHKTPVAPGTVFEDLNNTICQP